MTRDAGQANARLQAALDRHAGWQLEYDIALIAADRKRLLGRIDELTARVADLEAERDWTRQMLRYCYKRWPAPIFWQAAAQIDGPEESCNGYDVAEQIQAVVDTYRDRAFAGFIQADWDQGFGKPPSRYVVRDGRVVEVKAQIVWPEEGAA